MELMRVREKLDRLVFMSYATLHALLKLDKQQNTRRHELIELICKAEVFGFGKFEAFWHELFS